MKYSSKTICRYLALMGVLAISLVLYAADMFARLGEHRSPFGAATIDSARSKPSMKEAIERKDAFTVVETRPAFEGPSTAAVRTLPLGDASIQAAVGNAPPKVALLFLTRHTLKPLENIWTDWLQGSPIDWRLMFDLHIHVSDPSSEASVLQYPKNSVFRDAVLKDHVGVQWGNHSMITAERALFKQAMENTQVQTFVMLSEDSAPLYPALLTYIQLMLEPKSRINACNDPSFGDRMASRWIPRMLDAGLSQDLWRKSSQWVVLKRPHVEEILNDEELDRMFAKECYVCTNQTICFPQRFCVSDEHYIPSLFAMKGLVEECACEGMSMMTRWEKNAAHPKTFGKADAEWADDWVVEDEMRDGWNKDRDCGSLRLGRFDDWVDGGADDRLFVGDDGPAEALWDVLTWDEDKRNHLMNPGCPLFIRKISTDEEDANAWREALKKYIV